MILFSRSGKFGFSMGRKSCVPRRQPLGFTLVETALALGIVSFALVGLLGMLPIGLQVSRSASDLTITTQIGQRLVSLIEQAGYSSFDSNTTSNANSTSNSSSLEASYYYFDDQGQPLVAVGSTPPAGALYAASIVPAPTGVTASLTNASTVASLEINIVNDPGHVLSGIPPATVPTAFQSRCTVIPVFLANNGS